MINLLWRTDVHMSDFTPSSRKDDWYETVLGKLRQVSSLATGCDAVIDGGDFFDLKSPSRNSHRMVQDVIRVHSSYPCPVYACVGNHDVKYGDISYLEESPLGVLFESGTFGRLYDNHEVVIDKGGVRVRIVGVPYHGTKYDLERIRSIRKRSDDQYLVAVCHLLASNSGGKMFDAEDVLSYDDVLSLSDADVFCFGHWHQDQGVYERNRRLIVNVGSLTRGSLSKDNMERNPCVVKLEFTNQGVRHYRHNLNVVSATDVFDVEKKEKAQDRDEKMSTFVDSLVSTLSSMNGGVGFDEIVRSLDIPMNVRDRVLSYLEAAK